MNFNEFNFDEQLLEQIKQSGYKSPSPIQERTIPHILEGQDIFAQAETGSGKTATFVLPLIQKILTNKIETKSKNITYVVLGPTRELTQQTQKVVEQFGKALNIKSCCVIGGENMDRQKSILAEGVHFLVATPGRLKDLIQQKAVSLSETKGVVLDEADRLFDLGLKKDIEFILSKMPEERQFIMVSATSNFEVINMAHRFRSNPVEIKLNSDDLVVDHIDHQLAMLSSKEKMPLLITLLKKDAQENTFVFCNTQMQTHTVAQWLSKMGIKAQAISGRLPQNKRTRLMEDFRNGKISTLVCTDVAARGLDIKNVGFVINYDLPCSPENYVHRIGRTGRAGKSGRAISFCAHEDCEYLEAINKLLKVQIPRLELKDEDFAQDIVPCPRIDRTTLREIDPNNPPPQRGANRMRNSQEREPIKAQRRSTTIKQENDSPRSSSQQVSANDKSQKSDMKREERKPTQRTPMKKRFFEFTTQDEAQGNKEALSFFGITDTSLLSSKILKQGRKKYFFFGPRNTTYQYSVKPIYKKLLTPFLVRVLKLSKLNLTVRVSYKAPRLSVTFSGKDERLLLRDNKDLLFSFDHIIRRFLMQKLNLDPKLVINVRCDQFAKVREGQLIELANKMKKRVLDQGRPILLDPLSSAERRIIHQHLSADPKIYTESIGEERFKRIKIGPVA